MYIACVYAYGLE